jgi:branched-chain amino acid transport system ATP-binding protein
MTMLKVDDLQVYYGAIHAVKGISFEVNEGEIVSLIGANGAGKSTTMNTIAGLIKPKEGKIVYKDEDITGLPAHKIVAKGMALCPEGRRVFSHLTVQENLEMGGYLRTAAENADTMEKVYTYFPRLKERKAQTAGTLSGGEQQMLAMGRALMSHPQLLMLDEPSMGLAPILVDEIFDIIETLNKAGHDDSARRAECPDGSLDCRQGLCPRGRQYRPRGHRQAAPERSCRQERLPWRLRPYSRQIERYRKESIHGMLSFLLAAEMSV